MIETRTQKTAFNLLKISVFLVFVGRAWQHLFWDAPFRAFFWDERLLGSIVQNFFNTKWEDYVTSLQVDNYIGYSIVGFGIMYGLGGYAALKFNFEKGFFKWLLVFGSIGLILLAFLLMKENFYRLSQFFEYSLQFSIPLVLVYYKKDFVKKNLENILKVLVAVVFVAHGLFALGYYPVPGYFLGMVINIFDCTEAFARNFLFVAGVLDMVVALLIFIPKISKYALMYAFLWGIATSLARIVSGFYFEFFWQSIHLNLFQMIYRLPHGLIPLMLLFLQVERNQSLIKQD